MRGYKKYYKQVVSTDSIELTEEQKEVLYYLTQEFLTPSQIAKIRNTSPQATSKLIRKLKQKGIISEVVTNNIRQGVASPTLPSSDKVYRYHKIGLRIRILHQTEHFIKLKKNKENRKPIIDTNSIEIIDDLLICYFNVDFWGVDTSECIFNYISYLNRFIYKLEQEFKVILIKKNIINYEQFSGEIAKVNDPIARRLHLNKQSLKIKHNVDGKPRLITDRSFKWNELEAVHSVTHREDMHRIEQFQKDLIEAKEFIGITDLKNIIEEQNKTIQNLIESQKNSHQITEHLLIAVSTLIKNQNK